MKLSNLNKSYIAVLAAVLYAVCIPCAKVLSNYIPNAMLGAFLYPGTRLELLITSPFFKDKKIKSLTKQEIPYTVSIVFSAVETIPRLFIFISALYQFCIFRKEQS